MLINNVTMSWTIKAYLSVDSLGFILLQLFLSEVDASLIADETTSPAFCSTL